MARRGVGYFDSKGHFFKSPNDATASDLSALLGQIGEGDSLAPGIANMLLEKRAELEAIFAEHDAMTAGLDESNVAPIGGRKKVAMLGGAEVSESDKAS